MRAFTAGILVGMAVLTAPAAWAQTASEPDTALWRWLWQREGWSPPGQSAADLETPTAKALGVLDGGDAAQARTLARAAAKQTPNAIWPLLLESAIETTGKDRDAAVKLAEIAVQRAPRSALARMILAEAKGGLKEPGQGLTHWLIASGAAPELSLPLLKVGEALWLMGDQSSARLAFEAVLRDARTDALPAAALGSFYLLQHDAEGAMAAFTVALEARPDDPVLLQLLEGLYLDAGKPERAFALYEQAIVRRPLHWPLHFRLAGLVGRFAPDRLAPVLARAERRFANSATTLVQLGALAIEGKLYSEAEQYFQRALRRDPGQVAAYTGLANVLLSTNRGDAAESTLRQAVQQQPDFAEGHHLLGILALQRSAATDAIRSLEEAHRLNPTASNTIQALALAYRLAELPARAVTLMQGETALHPRQVDSWLGLGDAQADAKAYPAAVESYTKASELQPLNGNVFYALGNACSLANQPERAIIAYNRSILLEPENLDARNNLGNVYLKAKQTDAAIDQFERLLNLAPGYATGYYNLACAYALQHEADEAFKLLDRAIALDAKLKDVARGDSDFDAVRGDVRFRKLVGADAPAAKPAAASGS